MKKFSDLLREKSFNNEIEFPSVSVALDRHTLSLRFDSKDVVIHAGYSGEPHPWLSSLCFIIEGKNLSELLVLTWKNFEDVFRDDQAFWDLRHDESDKFFHKHFELLKACCDVYRGREYLYQGSSPLVCRCFGVRESDILEHLQKEEAPTLETLAGVSKAGMGCRSCVPQLKRWLVIHETKKQGRYYKDRPVADWLLDIDQMVANFPGAQDWKMEVETMKGDTVIISFDKETSQLEEEKTGKELQVFLGTCVDSDLAFFLRRARHFSKAKL